MSEDPWLAIAVIIRPHALRGAVQLKPYTPSVEEFIKIPLKRVFIRDRDEILPPMHLESMGRHKGLPLVMFQEVRDRTAAEALKGMEVLIPRDERNLLPEGTLLPDEIKGLEVVCRDSGKVLGKVLRLEHGPAHDHLIFTHPLREGGEVMLPKVPAFVHQIDLDGNRVVVTLPEGLLEL